MISVTKIFRFEMAHAIAGYNGKCKNLHGHSYQLQVTVRQQGQPHQYMAAPGFVIDFKELKKIVNNEVIEEMDHKLYLSKFYLKANTEVATMENLVVIDFEPTAENLLIFISNKLADALPVGVMLHHLKLFETADSFAEWFPENQLVLQPQQAEHSF